MTKLYHGTASYNSDLECEDLRSGLDGMIHMYPDQEAVGKHFDYVVECDTDLDLEKVPTVPDLVHWDPLDIAIHMSEQGYINDRELDNIETAFEHKGLVGEQVLFDTLRRKGVHAVKYQNRFEENLKDDWSVAIIDTKVLHNPQYTKTKTKEPDFASVQDAVKTYKSQDDNDWLSKRAEYRERTRMFKPRNPTRTGRGQLGR